jgi:NDP-sugar pyrophosphorylase family protein
VYALIIAGGEGERLRPLTSDRPKAMIPVAGRPLIDHQLDWLRRGGLSAAVILCGYKASVLMEHLGDGPAFGLDIVYSVEDEPLGRGGALRKGFDLVPGGEDTVVALNGDILTGQPLEPLLRYHRRKGAVATVMLSQLRSPYGITTIDRSGRVVNFIEKPLLPHWVNAGVYALSREFFSLLPERGDHEETTFPELSVQGKLYGYKSTAFWRAMDTFKDLREAEDELRALAGA